MPLMNILTNPFAWLVMAAVIMVSELVIPGGIVFFLGAACALVSGALYLGLVETWHATLTLFFVSSMILVVGLRAVVTRFAEGDSSVGNTEEILDEIDQVVLVLETIGPVDKPGLVKFRGSQWRALGDGREIPAGASARIVSRENITLLVEPDHPVAAQFKE